MKKSALVTGAAGFIGSFVSDELIRLGFQVVTLDDLSGGFRQNVNPKAIFIQGSMMNTALLEKLFRKYQFTYVYHLGAYAAEGLSHFIKRFNYENNVIGSVNLINASVNHNVKCFVFTSSIAVYGKKQLPMTEDLIPEPEDSYGIAKLVVEKELEISHRMFGLPYVIFRPHNVYGEKQNIGDRYRNAVGIFMNQILLKQPITIFGDGKQTRAFTYILDVAPVIAKAPLNQRAYGQIFNIGADHPYTLNELAKRVIKTMAVGSHKVVHLAPRNEVKHAYSDHKKLERYFGYKVQYDLDEGLRRMARWVWEHKARKSKEFKNIEILKNLPPSWVKGKKK